MTISLIVAASTNNAIGKDGKLLWSLPDDMKFFKNTTWGMPIIMGRKTFEDFNQPLPGRMNIVITRNTEWHADNTSTAASLPDALQLAETSNCKEIFIIGGGDIFKQSMDLADKIYLTRVHAVLEGDAFFPEIDESKWEQVFNVDHDTDAKHAYSFSFQTWVKKQ